MPHVLPGSEVRGWKHPAVPTAGAPSPAKLTLLRDWQRQARACVKLFLLLSLSRTHTRVWAAACSSARALRALPNLNRNAFFTAPFYCFETARCALQCISLSAFECHFEAAIRCCKAAVHALSSSRDLASTNDVRMSGCALSCSTRNLKQWLHMKPIECQKRPITVSNETFYSVKRDLSVSKETYFSVNRDLLQCQKRPITVSKETYYSVKRDLIQCQKRPAHEAHRHWVLGTQV